MPKKLYIAPDTNFLLHGKPLEDIANIFAASYGAYKWLFVRTIIKELDDKTHHPNGRIKRRASAAIRYLHDGPTQRSAGTDIETFFPIPPPEYVALGFDPYDSDDKIRAEIVLFTRNTSDVSVLLLTLDQGMRIQAKVHDVSLVEIPDDFRAVEEEDEADRELRAAKRRIDELISAQPKLHLSFEKELKEIALPMSPPLSEEKIEEIVMLMSAPEKTTTIHTNLLAGMAGMWREDDRYEEHLAEYQRNLRGAIQEILHRKRFYSLRFLLHNEGDAEADDIQINLRLPEVVHARQEIPEEPTIPSKPQRYVLKPMSHFEMAAAMSRTQTLQRFSMPALRSLHRVEPIRRGPDQQDERNVHFWERSLRQRQSSSLSPLLIEISRSVGAFNLGYELRAKNLIGIQSGQLLIKITSLCEDEALARLKKHLNFACLGEDFS